MQQPTIYAFDFDGVICDSAIETSLTGWKAAQLLWHDMPKENPSQTLINQFREVRPLLETGYEAILIMRLLQSGINVKELCHYYKQHIARIIQQNSLQTDELKKLFGETRDTWIQADKEDWLTMNPLFSGIAEKIQSLSDSIWYIITTKQERFVKHILQANQLHVEDSQLFGMDRQMNKQDTLLLLQKNHPEQPLLFVEDRIQTLLDILTNPQLDSIALQLVTWGYNTKEDRDLAQNTRISIVNNSQQI